MDKGKESRADTDPSQYRSERADRGPLLPGWIPEADPVMCCYKLATINCNASFVRGTLESMVEKVFFFNIHALLF